VLEALADERAAHAAAGASGAGGEAPLEVREQADQILSAVADLPEAQRHVFELGVVQELAYSEIAALLGVPEGTVKSRMFHAVRQVREALSGKRVAGRAEGRAGGRAEERAGAAQELQP
jgi:RNA polymerase sigma-70 factor (ECF subfamily)